MIQLDHCILRASAGTGKTFALSNRFLALLFLGAPAPTILATTFTRKAAGEVLERVLVRLAQAAASDQGAAELQQALGLEHQPLDRGRCLAVLTQLCRSLHRLSIVTLDSFMARIARSFRLELGLPIHPVMVDAEHPQVQRLRQQAIEAVLAEQSPGVLADLLRRLHHDAAVRSVSGALDDIIGQLYDVYRQAPDPTLWNRLPVLDGALHEPILWQMTQRLQWLEKTIPISQSGQPNQTWVKAWKQTADAAARRDWPGFLQQGLVQALSNSSPRFAKIEISSAWLAVLAPLRAHARASQLLDLARQTQATFELLQRFDRHYTRLRHQQQVLLFSDLPRILARELPKIEHLHTELYYRLDARVQHLLLDEFQDTSLEQWQVLEPLAQEIRSQGDGSRTFFCVGDAKQAIYAWRGGCAELLDKVATDLQLQAPRHQASLTRSFRSSATILETVNRIFGALASNPVLEEYQTLVQSWQKRFEPHQAAKNLPGFVELVTSPAATQDPLDSQAVDAGGSDGGQADPDQASEDFWPDPHRHDVARRVLELHRQLPDRSIGILVRSNKVIRPLLFALHELGVPASGEGASTLTDDPAVNAVLAALTLADHPGDQVAAFHLAHGPMGEILGLGAHQGPQVEQVSGQLRRLLLTQGYAATIEHWRGKLAGSCGARSRQRLAQLVELADRYETERTLRPSHFVKFVRQTSMQEPTPAGVRVMTIHQSKGLEFDQVVLPELHVDLGRMPPLGVYVLRPEPTQPIAAVFRSTNQQTRDLSKKLQDAYEQERARQLQDHLCTLYVAMTRARQGLLMVLPPLAVTRSGKISSKGWSNLSYASILRQALSTKGPDESPAGGQVLYAQGNPRWMDQGFSGSSGGTPSRSPGASSPPWTQALVSPLAVQIPAPPADRLRLPRQVSPSALEGDGRWHVRSLLHPRKTEGKKLGVFIHACLEQIQWLEDATALPEDCCFLEAAKKVLPAADPGWLQQSLDMLRALLEQPQVRRVFAKPPGPVQLWRERAFWILRDHELWSGKFDRVVVHESETQPPTPQRAELWDFKTDTLEKNPDALAKAAAYYQPQIRAYRLALQSLLKLPEARVSCHLVLLRQGRVIAIS